MPSKPQCLECETIEGLYKEITDFALNEFRRRHVRALLSDEEVVINSRDYWVKVVEMLQQNWALIHTLSSGACMVFFIGDDSKVFDEMVFSSVKSAKYALKRNGFSRFATNKEMQEFLRPPGPHFTRGKHPNGPIYSSGRYWH